MDTKFFDAVRQTLADGLLTQHQVDVFNAIGEAWNQYGDDLSYSTSRLAYVLATAWHETGRFRWLREIWGPTAAQKRYEDRDDLGNTVAGDGKKFMGRGLAHITGRRNYTDWSKRLGIDLLKEPAKAEELPIAARILVEGSVKGAFTGKRLSDYINSDALDYVSARRVINGTDKAALIAVYAEKFAEALAGGASSSAAPQQQKPVPANSEKSPKGSLNPIGIIAAIIILAAIAAAFFVRF